MIVCGKGNNGGDGYAAASILHNDGLSVMIHSITTEKDITNESLAFITECISLGIPNSDTENFQNKIFGLETNSEELNAIDYKKGCYVGQENTARMKLKEKISRRIYPIEIVEGNIGIDEIIKINNIEIGKIINNSNFPFGLFKFKDPNFKLEEILNTDKAKIKAKKPFWS